MEKERIRTKGNGEEQIERRRKIKEKKAMNKT